MLTAAPRGDGHPVLLLPGFMGSEASLIGLEMFLRNRGYAVETWGLGRNVGFHARHATALEQKIRYMHHKSGPQGQPGGLEPRRRVRPLRRPPGPGMRALGGHARQPAQRRSGGQRVAAPGQGDVPADRPPDGDGGAQMQPRARKLRERKICRCRSAASIRSATASCRRRKRPSTATRRSTRTSACRAATSGWASTPSCSGSSPTGFRSPKASGARSSPPGRWATPTGC